MAKRKKAIGKTKAKRKKTRAKASRREPTESCQRLLGLTRVGAGSRKQMLTVDGGQMDYIGHG